MTQCFIVDDLNWFIANLEERGYHKRSSDGWVDYAKDISKTITKIYAYPASMPDDQSIPIRISYELLNDGKPLKKLIRELKKLNYLYRRALPGWKTKRTVRQSVRKSRWEKLQNFLQEHGELIGCFQYEITEGMHAFNLRVASTPIEQAICLQFVKELAEAATPHSIVRGRREADEPVHQRNGWIKRFTREQKKRGWDAREIVSYIQKQLRDGTWNERSRLQYNIANSTIARLAGIKISVPNLN